jgi:uncharacterized membrane protein YphA (DoxX/SURF4 family)
MTHPPRPVAPFSFADVPGIAARWLLAAIFIYMGTTKALHPEDFLKLVRQYGVVSQPLLLNLVAATLPWVELSCGLLLLAGVAVRGTAVLLGVMLISFTVLVVHRALELHQGSGLPFCAISFDCGCGTGVVPVCRKVAENSLLVGLSGWLVFSRQTRFCLRHKIVGRPASA